MNSTALRNSNATLPVSKWDVRIRDNKRRRNAEIRRHFVQLILAAGFICIAVFGINSIISRAGDTREEELSFKYYKNICIEPGETLTSIARTYADREHYSTTDKYIQEVVYMNHLEDADAVAVGDYLIIPYHSNKLLK